MPSIEDALIPYPELNAHDITLGADPYVFKQDGLWHMLLQEDVRADAHAHNGLHRYTIRSAARIEDLHESPSVPLSVSHQSEGLRQVWAAEIHFGKYLYVCASDGNNATHRHHVYETEGNVYGPWKHLGELKTSEDRWAIDITFLELNEKLYAVWSGWEDYIDPEAYLGHIEVVPQHIYIAEFISPTKIGPRHHILAPVGNWCCSVAPILEGPQALTIDGTPIGFTVTGNASWTENYATSVAKYIGGNPLLASSWHMSSQCLFNDGYGIGHGIVIEDNDTLYYIGHRKTRKKAGWEDRIVFYTKLDKERVAAYLNSEHYASYGIETFMTRPQASASQDADALSLR